MPPTAASGSALDFPSTISMSGLPMYSFQNINGTGDGAAEAYSFGGRTQAIRGGGETSLQQVGMVGAGNFDLLSSITSMINEPEKISSINSTEMSSLEAFLKSINHNTDRMEMQPIWRLST